MTLGEINRKINKLRGFDGLKNLTSKGVPKDWHADANWPTLLREMPRAHLYYTTDNIWSCFGGYGQWGSNAYTSAEAVCRAWLKWKEQS